MKIALICISLVLFSAQASFAFWPFTKKPAPVVQETPPPQLYLGESQYRYSYATAKEVVDDEKYVICSECPKPNLERDLAPVDIAIRYSSDTPPAEQASPVAQQPVAPALPFIPAQPEGPAMIASVERAPTASIPPAEELKEFDLAKCVPPVLFDLDQSVVKEDELKNIIAGLECLSSAARIEVHGYTCDLGSKEHNDKLAKRRSESVADVLKQHGLKPAVVDGVGKCCFVSDSLPENRRVEIIATK